MIFEDRTPAGTPMKVFVKGLNSCAMRKQKLNQYKNFLMMNGHVVVHSPENSDAILLWTCAFRGDVRDNSIAEIVKYAKEYDADLIVAGCLPDISPKPLEKAFSGKTITWINDGKGMEEIFGGSVPLDSVPSTFGEENLCDDTETFRKDNPDADATFHDQFIKIVVSEGCRFECSYCSERLAFPPYHSFPEDELADLCRRMIEKSGKNEVILLADSLGDYGCDTGRTLITLIDRLKQVNRGIRIALNNLNPASFMRFFDDMVALLRDGTIRHLNLPIQSASSTILKGMNRPYTREDLDRIFSMLNGMGFREFDTHVILGFPGETEEDFLQTVRFVLEHRPKYVLASGFMESEGMDAAKLPGKIDEATKRRRMRDLAEKLGAAGIICNSDDSELSADRLRRLNKIGFERGAIDGQEAE